MKEKKEYVAPAIDVADFKPEKGFAESSINNFAYYINQEVYMMTLDGQEVSQQGGNFTASNFSDGGELSGGSWVNNADGSWF